MNNSEVRKLFGYNLKWLRKQKKISQIELSEKVDLAFTFISDIENGKKWVSPETIEKLSKFLDVEVYQFFLPEDYVFQEDKSIEVFEEYAELEYLIDALQMPAY